VTLIWNYTSKTDKICSSLPPAYSMQFRSKQILHTCIIRRSSDPKIVQSNATSSGAVAPLVHKFTSMKKHFRHGTNQICHWKPFVMNLWRFCNRHRKRVTFDAPRRIRQFHHKIALFPWRTHFRHVTARLLWLKKIITNFVMKVTATWGRACWKLTWLGATLTADVAWFHAGHWHGSVSC
jgi:hypothetical protein